MWLLLQLTKPSLKKVVSQKAVPKKLPRSKNNRLTKDAVDNVKLEVQC